MDDENKIDIAKLVFRKPTNGQKPIFVSEVALAYIESVIIRVFNAYGIYLDNIESMYLAQCVCEIDPHLRVEMIYELAKTFSVNVIASRLEFVREQAASAQIQKDKLYSKRGNG